MDQEIRNENQLKIKELIRLAFEKAKRESKLSSKTAVLNFLAEQLTVSVSERTLQRYYKNFIEESDFSDGVPNRQILDSLGQYLGDENFVGFCNSTEKRRRTHLTGFQNPKLKKTVIGLSAAVLMGTGSYFAGTAKSADCMVWQETKYIEIPCDESNSEIYPTLPLDEGLMKKFRKIEVNKDTEFFEYGMPKVWYSKTNGVIEFFNSPGNHPATGKQLNPVTHYIINKYVLNKKTQ